MPAINFMATFEPALLSGEKSLTMRVPRVDGAPPGRARLKEDLDLWTGLRTKAARKIVTVRCVAVASVTFGPAGFDRMVQIGPGCVTDEGPAVSAILGVYPASTVDSLDRFARLDGFEDWRSLWGWHREVEDKRSPGRKPCDPIVRHLVAWGPM